jgi:hypothetical protein
LEENGQTIHNDHDDRLRDAGLILFVVFLEEELANKAQFHEVETSEELIDGLWADEIIGFGLSVTNVNHLTPVGEPEEAERDDHHDQDQRRGDGVNKTWCAVSISGQNLVMHTYR